MEREKLANSLVDCSLPMKPLGSYCDKWAVSKSDNAWSQLEETLRFFWGANEGRGGGRNITQSAGRRQDVEQMERQCLSSIHQMINMFFLHQKNHFDNYDNKNDINDANDTEKMEEKEEEEEEDEEKEKKKKNNNNNNII